MKSAMTFLKWKTAAFFSFWWGLELPPRPKGMEGSEKEHANALIGGVHHRFVRKLSNQARVDRSARLRFMQFLTSVLYSKKGMPRPDETTVKAGEQSTFDSLTTARAPRKPENLPWPIRWGDLVDMKPGNPHSRPFVHDLSISQGKMEQEIRRTVREVLAGYSFSWKDRTVPFFPSTSANYIRSRSNGGAVSALLEENADLFRDLATDGGMDLREMTVTGDESRAGSKLLAYNSEKLDHAFGRFYIRLLRKAQQEPNVATPLGLAEALKVRVITKGPPLRMTVMKPLQRFLWRVLKSHRVFQLIGRPLDERVLLDSLGGKLLNGERWLSGDYSAATDGIESWASEVCANEIADCLNLSVVERQIFVEALTRHELEHNGVRRQQQRGQLMGSVVSFPILCIINAAVCRLAMEIAENRRLPIRSRSCRLLVNGDDCLFPITSRGLTIWKQIASFVGLEPSIGKFYFSDQFANINSTNYSFDPLHPRMESWEMLDRPADYGPTRSDPVRPDTLFVIRENPFALVQYVNLGLINGMKRSGRTVGVADVFSDYGNLGSRHRDLYRLTPEPLWSAVDRKFHQKHRQLLQSLAPMPWYLPEWIGGVGLVGTPSVEDCEIANCWILDWHRLPESQLPQRPPTNMSWKVRRVVDQLLRPFRHLRSALTDSELSEEETLRSRMAVSLLFRTRESDLARVLEALDFLPEVGRNFVEWRDLYDDQSSRDASAAAVTHCRRAWSRRWKEGKFRALGRRFGADSRERVANFRNRLFASRPKVGIPVVRLSALAYSGEGHPEHRIDRLTIRDRRQRITSTPLPEFARWQNERRLRQLQLAEEETKTAQFRRQFNREQRILQIASQPRARLWESNRGSTPVARNADVGQEPDAVAAPFRLVLADGSKPQRFDSPL